ncbi:CHAP domain-containing protein [Candidatus Saccharibacteria bacterium]|nr:CHAP domain-containing protein [Candidatus Saccharibacteria bacterium]
MAKLMKTKKFFAMILAGLLVVPTLIGGVFRQEDAYGISLACRNSPECMEAVEKERKANQNAASASSSADMLQKKVQELNVEIAGRELEIVETQAQVKELEKQIKETEEKLKNEQEALTELLVGLHFEGDAEPITILAGSSSISDLAERQARSEVVKQQISATAQKVKEAKLKLEEDKAKVEELLEQQKSAKAELVAKRTEQQQLVEKYQNDAAAYAQVAEDAKAAQRAAEQAEQEAHPERYSGSSYTGVNTYPWQGDCPQRQDDYGTVWNGYYIGGYVCECVSYTGWKAYEAFGKVIAWGNAYSWDDRARSYGYRVDHTPEADSIGQVDGGMYGHVFWVESVNADGSINVTEYNNAYATKLYSGSFHYGDFGARTISASEVWQYNYIHLK